MREIPRYLVPIALTGLLFGSSAAQVRVETMQVGLEEVTHLPTSQLALFRTGELGEFEVLPGLELEEGQTLVSRADSVLVQLVCPAGSAVNLISPFRVDVVSPTEGEDCLFNVLAGYAQVLTDTTTGLRSGLVSLGSERTAYALYVGKENGRVKKEAFVFEGSVLCTPDPSEAPVSLTWNEKFTLDGDSWSQQTVQNSERERAADVYARADAARAVLPRDGDRNAVYQDLRKDYETVLKDPTKSKSRLDLAARQIDLELPRPALHQLRQVERLSIDDTKVKGKVAFQKGIVYQQMGDTTRAQVQIKRAQELDRDAVDESLLRRYNIGTRLTPTPITPIPPVVPAVKVPEVRVSSSPPAVKPNRRSVIRVLVALPQEPVGLADITLETDSGAFPMYEGARTISGRTDMNGTFVATWLCQPCRPQNTVTVTVTKPGFQEVTRRLVIPRAH